MLKLGTMVTDTVTNQKGMLTVFNVDMGKNKNYVFQPAGLNPKTKKPLDTYWVTKNRVEGGIEVDNDLPMDILGSQATDKATGFKGTIISLDKYINGCIHVEIKPNEVLEDTLETVSPIDFDIRRLEGEKIPVLNEKELEESKKNKPSPEFKPSMNKK